MGRLLSLTDWRNWLGSSVRGCFEVQWSETHTEIFKISTPGRPHCQSDPLQVRLPGNLDDGAILVAKIGGLRGTWGRIDELAAES